jgi:hypothetical protein
VFLGGNLPNMKLTSLLYLQTTLKMCGAMTVAAIWFFVMMLNQAQGQFYLQVITSFGGCKNMRPLKASGFLMY